MTAPRKTFRHSGLAVAAALATLLAMLVWTWTTINPAVVDVTSLEQDRLPKLELIQHAQFADLEASIALRNALLFHDPGRTGIELARYNDRQREAVAALAQLKLRTTSAQGQALLRDVMEARARVHEVRETARRMEEAHPDQVVPDEAIATLRPSLDVYLRATQRLYDFESENMLGLVGGAIVTAERARVLLALSGCVAAAALLLLVRQGRREAQAELARKDGEILRLNEQRSALVREVHHRIKNHLQGLLTLIEGQAADGRLPSEAVAQLQAYVAALLTIHGLQAARADEGVPLRELVARQVPLVEAGYPGASVTFEDDASAAALVPGTHAVPLSLALTELMFNAVKHGADHSASVQVFDREGACCVCVTNQDLEPAPFDVALGHGLGTGLRLVTALLEGVARLVQERGPDGRLRMTVEIAKAAA